MPADQDPGFSLSRYQSRRGEVLLHMSHFFMRYLGHLYRAFAGDLSMVIVLGEISHHNTAKFFSPRELNNDRMLGLRQSDSAWAEMEGCNAFSISCATGIPRETVRRKVAELRKRGWIEDVPKEGLRITKACADHFGPDFSLTILSELLTAARAIERILAPEPLTAAEPGPKACKAPHQPGSKPSAVRPANRTRRVKPPAHD